MNGIPSVEDHAFLSQVIPNRVIDSEGYAEPWREGMEPPAVILVRADGWKLASTRALMKVALSLWDFTGYWYFFTAEHGEPEYYFKRFGA